MKQKAVRKDCLCPICYNKRGAFVFRKTEGICEACVLRMMFAFDHTVKGGSLIRHDRACFCCHRQVDADKLHGGACSFCRQAGLLFLGAHKNNKKINKRPVPAYPPAATSRKDSERFRGDPLEYLNMFWSVPEDTEWEEDSA